MRARHDTFLGVFRAADPLGSDEFRLLCDEVAATPDPKLLHEFLAALNRDLVRRLAPRPRAESYQAWRPVAMENIAP